MMATSSQPARGEYSPLFTQGLYSANPASRRHLQSSSFLDVDSPSESGDDTDASMASFVGSLRPNTQAGRAVSPTPTVRPAHAGPSRPSHARLAGIPAPAPPPNHALPSVPPQAGGYPMQPQQRGAPIPGHARSPTAASYASSYASPADQRMAALARLEGRPAPPPNQRPPPPPQQNGYPQNGYSQNGYAPPPSGASFLSLSDAPQGRSYPSQPRRS